jgi:hypothetical protein
MPDPWRSTRPQRLSLALVAPAPMLSAQGLVCSNCAVRRGRIGRGSDNNLWQVSADDPRNVRGQYACWGANRYGIKRQPKPWRRTQLRSRQVNRGNIRVCSGLAPANTKRRDEDLSQCLHRKRRTRPNIVRIRSRRNVVRRATFCHNEARACCTNATVRTLRCNNRSRFGLNGYHISACSL